MKLANIRFAGFRIGREEDPKARLSRGDFCWALIGAFLLAGRSAQAQQPPVATSAAVDEKWNYTIRSWQSQDGLPEETVQAFAQTPDGYLWVGTSGGLLRFDGARFRLVCA